MNSDGTDQTRLTENNVNDFDPSWAANEFLVFVSDRTGSPEIYMLPFISIMEPEVYRQADDRHIRVTTNGAIYGPAFPRAAPWSFIAFHSDRDHQIRLIYLWGGVETVLTQADGNDWDVDWSTDGTKIAFASNRDGNFEIYVGEIDGL